MKITNPCTVHQVWGDLADADLLAIFQSPKHAVAFCTAEIEHQPGEVTLMCVNHWDGSMRVFRKAKKEPA